MVQRKRGNFGKFPGKIGKISEIFTHFYTGRWAGLNARELFKNGKKSGFRYKKFRKKLDFYIQKMGEFTHKH